MSGRILSEHVDKFAPNQPIVNTNYVENQQALNQVGSTSNIPILATNEVQTQDPTGNIEDNNTQQEGSNIVSTANNPNITNNKVNINNISSMPLLNASSFTGLHPMLIQQNKMNFTQDGTSSNLLPNNNLLSANNMMLPNMMNNQLPPNMIPNTNFTANPNMMNIMGGDKNLRQNFPLHQYPPFNNQNSVMSSGFNMNNLNMMNNNMNFNHNLLNNNNPNFNNTNYNQIR